MGLEEVTVSSLSPERFRSVLGERYGEVEDAIERARELFRERVVWHVNSTARGGGVVELLQSLLAYTRGAGVDTRWTVIQGNPEFFRVTKRIHNNLHGSPGDGGELGAAERDVYETTLAGAAGELAELVRSGDVIFLHDPQTAGLVPALGERGVTVVWRCHVGLDLPNDLARRAWSFLRGYVEDAHAYVFSRREFAWEGLNEERTWIVPPSIDAFSPKNQEMSPEAVRAIVARIGLVEDGEPKAASFARMDGSPGRVDRRAEMVQERPLPPKAELVTQVSRWDRLKDPAGVLASFAEHLPGSDAHLLLAGPSVDAVSDDPEGAEVLTEITEQRARLPRKTLGRVHLACLPMADVEENAAIVNAIQRRSTIVVQKSLAEGFGLTVAEAMWKARPVVASRRGGMQDQIVDGESGILLDDPGDLDAAGQALRALFADPERADAMGEAARQRVTDHFLGTRHLIQYLDQLAKVLR